MLKNVCFLFCFVFRSPWKMKTIFYNQTINIPETAAITLKRCCHCEGNRQPQGALITCTQSSVSFQEEELWDDKGRNRKTTILSNFSHIGDYHNQWYALVSTLTLRNKSLAIKYALVQHTFTAFKPPDDAYSI